MPGKFKMVCRDCIISRYGPYITISTKATKHSIDKRHHVQVFGPGGLLIHDMDIKAIQEDMGVPPY